jgi:hypothetical protein
MPRAKKEITNILLETGIQMLKIVQELNEKDQLFPNEKPKKLKEKKNDSNTKAKSSASKKNNTVPH